MEQPQVDSAATLLTSEECVLTLAKVLDNILTETTYEKKTRKLKLTNETFSRRVARHPGGVEFLLGCYFTRKNNHTLVLKRDNEDKMWLWNARGALHDRSLVLGFVLPPMPPSPIAQHDVSEGKRYHESASLYETSTIGTMDELDAEIMKELEDDGFESPAQQKPEYGCVSPLHHPNISTADRLLSDQDQSSLVVPALPKATPPADRPNGLKSISNLPPRPPKLPRSPSKSQPAMQRRMPPNAKSMPKADVSPEEDPLLKDTEEELELECKSETTPDLAVNVAPEEDPLLKEMEEELECKPETASGEDLVTKADVTSEEDTLLKEMEEELESECKPEPTVEENLVASTDVVLEEDPLLKEMEEEFDSESKSESTSDLVATVASEEDPLLTEVEENLEPSTSEEDPLLKETEAELKDDVVLPISIDTSLATNLEPFQQKTMAYNGAQPQHVEKEVESPLDDALEMEVAFGNHANDQLENKQVLVHGLEQEMKAEQPPQVPNTELDLHLSDGLSPPSTVDGDDIPNYNAWRSVQNSGCADSRADKPQGAKGDVHDMAVELNGNVSVENKGLQINGTEIENASEVASPDGPVYIDETISGGKTKLIGAIDFEINDESLEKESPVLSEAPGDDLECLLLSSPSPVVNPIPPVSRCEVADALSAPQTDNLEQEMFAFLQHEKPRSVYTEEMEDVFGSSMSSFDITAVESDSCISSNPQEDSTINAIDRAQIIVKVRPPPVSKSQDGLKEFFSGTENASSSASHDSDDELPVRTPLPRARSGDDLEKEMASLLAQSTEIPLSNLQPSADAPTRVQELDGDSGHSRGLQCTIPDDDSIAGKSLSERTHQNRLLDLDNGTAEDFNYSSVHAHSDWLKLTQLMKQNSLLAEYEACWGCLCTLSVVCADLPTEEFGLSPPSINKKKNRKNRSKRSWLPLELVQGLWNLVLSTENSLDASRVAYVCSKLHDVLVDSQYLEILERDESGASLPHSTWVRVKKEKMVLLGFALPISIARQSEWMRKLAKAIVDDTQFWYGRYALPTIAIAGGDKQATAKSLLRDVDFVQSRLDVIGIVTGTRRHVLDCKSYIKAKKQAFKDKQFRSEEFKIEIAEETGNDVALDGCQQVVTSLYRQGQVFSKSDASAAQMIELAAALHVIGMAVGEFGDWEMEMQLYQKTIDVLQDCGGHNTECAADTRLSMGDCRLGQGDPRAAMGCYEEAHDIYRSQLGENSNQVAKALHHMGVIHCETGELNTAMEVLKTSLKIKRDNGMKEDYDEHTADTLCWIGRVYREQGLPDKARKYFDTARDVKGDYCGADSLEVAEILHNIAVLYDDSGDFERSLRYYRKSLKIRRAALGDQHEDVCDIIACIGNVYKSMGDEHTALKVFRHANELRSSVAKKITLNKQQTKTLIHSYEDILDILRIQHKTSETPDVEQNEIASILLKMGQLYDTNENFGKSDRCFDKSLKLMITAGDKITAGQVLNVKGISFAKRQKYKEAMAAFEQALALRKEALGSGHVDVAETLHNMGNCAAKAGDLNDARTYYDEALRIKRQRLGSNNTSVAQTLHNIGNVLVGQGKNDAAMRSYQEALNLRRDVLGSDNIEVAYSLHCIAKINRKQHNIEAAREHFTSALRIKRHELRKNHPSVAETLEQLGSLYMDIGEEDEATLCLNGALNIYKSKHGEGVKVAHVYEQLGGKCERQKNTSKAIVYFNKSLQVRVRVFGDDHVSVADMHYRIGKLQRDQGSFFEALAAFQAATRIRKKIIGRDDLIIADVLTDAGKLQMTLGQVEIADKCFGEALRIRNLILDPRHEKIGECLLLNGEVLVKGGKYQEAIELFREALSIFQDNTGEFGLLCADAYQHLGTVYKITEDYDKAQENYEKCLKTRNTSHSDEHLGVAKVHHGLGEVYFARGDYRRAEEYFRDSVEVLVTHLGEDHMDVANAVLSLGRTCTKLNSPDEATMYFEQAKLTKQHHLGDAHLEVLEISLEIGRAHAAKKEYADALQCFQAYLRARRAAVGDDVTVCDILLEIGTVEYDMKRYDDALTRLASALALYRVLLGDDQVPVATTLYSLGVVYEAKRGFKESMKYHKEAFRLRRRLLGPDDLDVAHSLDKISGLYMKQPNLEKALHSMKEVLRIRTQELGTEHVDVGSSLFGMGVIFAESNELEKALECYQVSLKIRTAHFGEASVEAAQTLHNMGTVLAKQQDFSSALEHWRRALVAYREAGLSDEDHLVAITIGNVNMAEAYLDDVAGTKSATNTEVRVN